MFLICEIKIYKKKKKRKKAKISLTDLHFLLVIILFTSQSLSLILGSVSYKTAEDKLSKSLRFCMTQPVLLLFVVTAILFYFGGYPLGDTLKCPRFLAMHLSSHCSHCFFLVRLLLYTFSFVETNFLGGQHNFHRGSPIFDAQWITWFQ